MDLGRGLGAHPVDDFLRIGQEGEDRGGRGRDLGLAPDDKRFIIRFSSIETLFEPVK